MTSSVLVHSPPMLPPTSTKYMVNLTENDQHMYLQNRALRPNVFDRLIYLVFSILPPPTLATTSAAKLQGSSIEAK